MSCSELCLPRFIRSLTYLFTALRAVSSLSVNRTIDDEKGDSVTGVVPSYSPVGSWSQGSTCSGCYIHLDTSQTFQGTWHDTTHTPGDPEPRIITAQFTGTAVYVFNVLANTVLYTTTFTSITFTLDGQNVGQFVHVPTDSTDFQYDVPVFASDSLPNGEHTLVIEANGATNSSLVLFDYIVYTFEDDPTTTSPPPVTTSSTTTHADPPTTTISDSTTTQQTTQTSVSSSSSLTTSGTGASPTSQQTSYGARDPSTPLHNSSGSISTSPAGDGASPSSQSSGAPTSQGSTDVASAQHSRIAVGAIAGGAAGGILVLVLAILLAVCCIRRRRRSASPRPRPLIDSDSFTETSLNVQSQPMLSSDASQRGGPGLSRGGSASFTPYARGTAGIHIIPTIPTTSSGALPYRSTSPLPDSSHNSSGSSTDYTSFPATPHRPKLPSAVAISNTTSPTPPATFDEDVKVPLDDPAPLIVHAPPTIPTAPNSSYARSEAGSVSTNGERNLRAQVAALREEVERLREMREMHELFEEAPPSYGES